MRSYFLPILAAVGSFLSGASAKSVFAHVLVGNTAAHTVDTWTKDINLAKSSGIDAFVLNVASTDSNTSPQVANAFSAAEKASFKLFFSFDYAASAWSASAVSTYLNKYKSSSAYFLYKGEPFVSTFEGVNNIDDWAPSGAIRSAVGNVYFVPDYSSLGPSGISSHLNNIQGAFNWGMWPDGASNMTTTLDLSWKKAVSGKSFMMGVAPWFFHSSSGGKDWVWRGDSLWADRWAQTLEVQPDFVEIVTWNDFGEAHYIGPINSDSEIPTGSAVYVDGMPHDSWRDFLPYYIAKYKGTSYTITKDQVQYWYRPSPAAGGSACGVVGNNADQSETELSANAVVEDGVFFSALLKSAATVSAKIGSGPAVTFKGVAGINHWSIPFNGHTGQPSFKVVRNGSTVAQGTGLKAITSSTPLSNGCTNYNAFVGSF